jgi:hypothetical protein
MSWIKTSERAPKEWQEVLAYRRHPGEDFYITLLVAPNDAGPGDHILLDEFVSLYEYWMKLPKPPKPSEPIKKTSLKP